MQGIYPYERAFNLTKSLEESLEDPMGDVFTLSQFGAIQLKAVVPDKLKIGQAELFRLMDEAEEQANALKLLDMQIAPLMTMIQQIQQELEPLQTQREVLLSSKKELDALVEGAEAALSATEKQSAALLYYKMEKKDRLWAAVESLDEILPALKVKSRNDCWKLTYDQVKKHIYALQNHWYELSPYYERIVTDPPHGRDLKAIYGHTTIVNGNKAGVGIQYYQERLADYLGFPGPFHDQSSEAQKRLATFSLEELEPAAKRRREFSSEDEIETP